MEFNYNDYKKMLYAAVEYKNDRIIELSIQPEISHHNIELRDKLIAMQLPEIDRVLERVDLKEILDIWDLLNEIENDCGRKIALDILADFANLYQEEFGREAFRCVLDEVYDIAYDYDLNDEMARKFAIEYFANKFLNS